MSLKIDLEKCVGCGNCMEYCAVNALFNRRGKTFVNEKCNLCGNCLNVCVVSAISFVER